MWSIRLNSWSLHWNRSQSPQRRMLMRIYLSDSCLKMRAHRMLSGDKQLINCYRNMLTSSPLIDLAAATVRLDRSRGILYDDTHSMDD
ncbi:unnamed protein product [Nippostrongylus brasiliensis]|uniref:Uncharacterized protein n=1 Tax=Nippostrongylus brasiliensis TaxID=27835 RepID=A0A0N4XJI9_NIPBR|nr:unnamed protein product [Nippostrongylus brasiliensis]